MFPKGQPSRRQEKIARLIRESVSDTITNHLSDPRIEGLVSVTDVEISADLREAEVSLSIFACDEAAQQRTFEAIVHASRRIQAFLGKCITSRYCPQLRFCRDTRMKKTLETLNLIEEVAREWQDEDTPADEGSQEDEDLL